MAKAVFHIEINGKKRKKTLLIPEKLAELSNITDDLCGFDFDDVDYEDSPFGACYDYLALKTTEIGAKHFKVNPEKYWAEFLQLTENEEDTEIAFSAVLVEVD